MNLKSNYSDESIIGESTRHHSRYYRGALHTFMAGMVAAGVLVTLSANSSVHAATDTEENSQTTVVSASSSSKAVNQLHSSSVSGIESKNSASFSSLKQSQSSATKIAESNSSSSSSAATTVESTHENDDISNAVNASSQSTITDQSSSRNSTSANSISSSSQATTTTENDSTSQDSSSESAANSSKSNSQVSSANKSNSASVSNKRVLANTNQTPDVWQIGDATRPRVDAVDVSSYQQGMTQNNFNELKKLGVKTVIVKLTEGDYYTNQSASQEITYARNAGLDVMVYHYATFNSEETATNEANYLLKELAALNLVKTTRIFADMENEKTVSDSFSNNLLSFFNVLNSAGYTDHAVYAYLNYQYLNQIINTVGEKKVWLAQYPYSPSAANLLNTQYGAWQNSSTAELTGYSGYLDTSTDYNGLLSYQSVENGFVQQNSNTYYYENNAKVTGQKNINDHWYYFDDKTGARKTGFQYIANQNKTVYYNAAGQMQYGQQKINGYWYLFDDKTGAKKTGFQYIANQNKTVYYNAAGQMQYGQQKINGYWYLFD
ncbi:MAG: GH25 family lysozyme, partial [Liquorilactobacillus ghanensis]|uniref:GH25 family lysozyme n=1 Tax=Liquorilactobacillus ghanensis TaxID=399370 RepID=UPI0039EC0B19